jgi:hypothetical protein
MKGFYHSKFETYVLEEEEQSMQESPAENEQKAPEQTVFPEGFFSEL